MWSGTTYSLFDGLTYNSRGYFASCVARKNTSNEQNVARISMGNQMMTSEIRK